MREAEWRVHTPPKTGLYIVTFKNNENGNIIVDSCTWSKSSGWLCGGHTVLAWDFMPEPWDGKCGFMYKADDSENPL